MSTDFVLPVLPYGGPEATLVRWLKQPGDTLAPGEPLLIVMNERVEVLLPAPVAGTFTEALAAEGASVRADSPLARIAAVDAQPAPATPAPGLSVRSTPLARRIAAALGIDLGMLAGSGPSGRILKRDVLAMTKDEGRRTTANQGLGGGGRGLEALHSTQSSVLSPQSSHDQGSGIGGRGSEALHSTQPSVLSPQSSVLETHALTAIEADMGAVVAYCERHAPLLAQRGLALTPLACVAQVAVALLLRFPLLNGSWHEDGILTRRRVHLGVLLPAHDDPAAPLVIPNAQDLNLRGFARALAPRSSRAAPRVAGTFTLAGGDSWVAALMPLPAQSALLSLSAVHLRPVVVGENGSERIAVRPIALLTLAYDARVLDQPLADAYLTALRAALLTFEAPGRR